MPIQIQSKTYTDIFGNDLSFYQSNAGDITRVELEIHASISISSLDSPFQLDLSYNPYEITSPSLSWLDEGFRIGDTASISIYDQYNPVPIITYPTTVNYVDDDILGVSTMLGWYDITQNQYAVIRVAGRERDTLDLSISQVLNSTAGTPFSLIDGEVSLFKFTNIDAMIVGDIITGLQSGLKSGQFDISTPRLKRITNPAANKVGYELTFEIINSGAYNSGWFSSNNCLKNYFKLEWASLANEPYGKTEKIVNDNANTGWFNEAYNTGIIDATLVQGINYLDYQYPTSGQIVIDSASAEYGFGGAYISIDDAYFKSRPYTQSELTMLLPTSEFTIGTPITSNTNEFGANYDLEITNVSTVGIVHTIDYTFTPNANFGTWFDSLEEGNRQFYLWAKWGSVNILLFNGQMETQPPVGGVIVPVNSIFFDHSQQLTEATSTVSGFIGNIEDDLAYSGIFRLEDGEIYESMTARIEAFNSVTLETFTLSQVLFDFTSVPFNGTQHLLNLTIPVQSQLPTTSVKRDASLFLYPAADIAGQYGINLYFPFLYRWEYWLPQTNADSDFYPNQQTKNWYPFDSTGDWSVRLHVSLVKNGLSYTFNDNLTINDYDSNPNIDQTIELYRVSTGQNVGVVIEGELHKVVATHTLTNGEGWDQNGTWGMITIEPTESSPRYIVSTVVPYDYNPNNPLTPISGTLVTISYPSPDVAVMECIFDPSVIDLTNGVKFTTKIKGCASVENLNQKITTDGIVKETTFGESKQIS